MSNIDGLRWRAVCSVALCFACWLAIADTSFANGDANETRCQPSAEGLAETSPGFRAFMPDCRAYETVTPAYTGGASVDSIGAVSPSGASIIGTSFGGFAGTGSNESNALDNGAAIYKFTRGDRGWTTEPLEPSAALVSHSAWVGASVNLERTLWEVLEGANAGEEDLSSSALFSLAIREPNGKVVAVGPEDSPQDVDHVQDFQFGGASGDLGRVVYSIEVLDNAQWPGDTTEIGDTSLYEYSGVDNSEPRLVGVRNVGRLEGQHLNEHAEVISDCGTRLGSAGSTYNAISSSGETIFFTANKCSDNQGEPEANTIFARVGEEVTIPISEPSQPLRQGAGTGPEECDAECATATPKRATFQGASSDGTKVFFTTSQPLLNLDVDESSDLYEAEIKEGKLYKLTLVSRSEHVGEAAEVQGVSRISENGQKVYFVASGALTGANGEGASPIDGEANLYSYDADSQALRFVATLVGSDSEDWGASDARPVETTSDGAYLLFLSSADLTGAEDKSSVPQLFEYDAALERISRVSIGQRSAAGSACPQTKTIEAGYNCNGNTDETMNTPRIKVPNYEGLPDLPTEAVSGQSITEDGRVVFQSRDALTPYALEGGKNVYEYSEGNVYLIAPGEDPVLEYGAFREGASESLRLLGVDPAGTSVFMAAVGQLAPGDNGSQAAWYDARSGGGFPAGITNVECSGEVCQKPISDSPVLPVADSAAISGEAPAAAVVGKPKRTTAPELTNQVKLKRALKICKKMSLKKRRHCEAAAKKKYTHKTSRPSKARRVSRSPKARDRRTSHGSAR